jgi:hypothetical protein
MRQFKPFSLLNDTRNMVHYAKFDKYWRHVLALKSKSLFWRLLFEVKIDNLFTLCVERHYWLREKTCRA